MPDAENTLVILTTKGVIPIELRPDLAPNHVERVITLARLGEYDNVAWHRIIDDFVVQTGDVEFADLEQGYDPERAGFGGSALPDLALESGRAEFLRGDLGMARSSDENSANSQFFITTADTVTLNGDFTKWGEVIDGLDVAEALSLNEDFVQIDDNTRILTQNPDRMVEVFLADDRGEEAFIGTTEDETLQGTGEDEVFLGLSGNDVIGAGGGSDWISGGAGDDSIRASLGADEVIAGAGDDTAQGSNGFDTLQGGSGNDMLFGGNGNDEISGGSGADTLFGGKNRDTLQGDNGFDEINGGNGHDQITGGRGNDTLTGGNGRDSFIYTEAGFGDDFITDFTLGSDRIIMLTDLELTFSQSSGNTVITADDGSTITLTGATGLLGSMDDVVLQIFDIGL